MKRLLFQLCLMACVALISIAGSEKFSEGEFIIEGEITGVEDGAVIDLCRVDDSGVGQRLVFDTIRNGRFFFREKALTNPEKLNIISMSAGFPTTILEVWVAPEAKIKIEGKGKLLTTWEVKSSIPHQEEENRYKNNSRDIIFETARISLEIRNLREKAMAASGDEAVAYKKALDSLSVLRRAIYSKANFANAEFMLNSNISAVWLDKMLILTGQLRGSNDIELRKKVENLYNKMSEEDKNTPTGYRITANLFPPPLVGVGDYFADTDFLDKNDKTKHLSDYLGKYLLLDFWSMACGPCIAALPEMKEVSETYRESLTIISISLDTDTRWRDAMNKHNMPWVNIRDPKGLGGLAANYGVYGIPNYVMISPEGKIVDKWVGFSGNGLLKRKVTENIK